MWVEMQAAVQVARLGTISAAAEALGVHRATVTRHIEALETDMGAKLFHRHARGYTVTEFGQEMLRIANATTDQMMQLRNAARGKSEGLSGELIITSVDVIAEHVMPSIGKFSVEYPQVQVRFVASQSLLKLEYGEAHVAFRLGPRPSDPDNVVKPHANLPIGLYASKAYAARHGLPETLDDLVGHRFIATTGEASRAPTNDWFEKHVSKNQIAFATNQNHVMRAALLGGLGIGFTSAQTARSNPDLVEVIAPKPEWAVPIWICTHVDLHRTAKVRAFLAIVKDQVPHG
jgi:DNA-binding transcriptional LysR family regulator